jgi:hypothetical protein
MNVETSVGLLYVASWEGRNDEATDAKSLLKADTNTGRHCSH